jgi:amino acid adenylation domain-containing protein
VNEVVGSLAERVASLSPEQRALFERLRRRQQEAAQAAKPPPIPRLSGPTGEGDWPLSLDQERFWFMEQLYPGRAGLNVTAATRVRGPLAPWLVGAALEEIARRHAAWRTTFPVAGGSPVQRVAAPRAAPPDGARRARSLALIDLAGLPPRRREPEAMRLVGEDVAAGFDLERGPLLRSRLIRVGAGDHFCLLTVHHLVTDWISFQIAWSEMAALYAALAAGRSPASAGLPEPPVHYPDFALWQRRWLQGEVLEQLVSWWCEQLAGVPLALELPTDRPRPAVPRMRGGKRSFTLGPRVAEGLRSLARQQGATLFMAVLAAAAALLHRDSGQERLILGANNANRNRPEIEPVLGCFLTQVPFVVDLRGDPTWRQLLARARQSTLGAFAHQDLPFGKLVEAVQPQRDPSRQPLVQGLVQVLDGQYSKAKLAGVTFEAVDAYDGRARYDLMLNLVDLSGALAGGLEYDADLFDATTAARMVERLLAQVEAAVADPDLRLSALPVLSAAARHQALIEWNDTAPPNPSPASTVPERVARQSAARPHAVAVVAGGEALSYGELDRRSDQLARRLRAAGAGPESRVALVLERSAEVPISILAVWKAGAAYVPLDAASPAERLALLLADAAPAVMVHRGPLPALSPPGPGPGPAPGAGLAATGLPAVLSGARSLDLAQSWSPAAADGAPLPGARPERLAYMIYTSGSTGRPKAVMVEHRSIAAVLAVLVERYALGPGERVPHLVRYTFDASLEELFAPLTTGGQLEIVAGEEVLDPAALLAVVERSTRLLVGTPALLRRLAAEARVRGPGSCAGLRTIAAGGEEVTPALQEELLAAFPATELEVLYGPTETTLVCTGHRVERGRRPERPLIGRPLPGVEARVIDARLGGGVPVPLGVPGELWIAGPGVARGYFGRDETTAERFVELDGRRFYRTGDLVRQLPGEGGALEFLGRIDHQVKVRGFRIEPGEIEAALLAHSAVREAVVVARPDQAGENRLFAYWVPAAPEAAAGGAAGTAGGRLTSELYAHLAQRLPEYMLPAAVVMLPALPLLPSGKVDRSRLPVVVGAGGAGGAAGAGGHGGPGGGLPPEGEAPVSPGEELVAGIWCEVLGLQQVSRWANFFELGGHSLLATQVVSRLRAATGAELPLQTLFRSPTVAGLAAALVAASSAGAAAAPPIRRLARRDDLPLSFAQERLWFLDRLAPGSPAYNIPLALAARGELSLPALAAALGEMVRRHEVLRTNYRVPPGRQQPVQVVAALGGLGGPGSPGSPGGCRLPLVDLSSLPAPARRAEARRIGESEVAHPFDLERDPVLRSLALRLATGGEPAAPAPPGGAAEHVLLFLAHHIAADGWSVDVMVKEIAALYGAALAGEPSPLPELAVQYADFAVWQREWLQGEALERQLAFWREELAGAPALALAADRPRPAAPSFRGATRSRSLGPAATRAARGLARRADATLFMVLLAAVHTLLGRHAGQEDVVVGSAIANRTRAEIEPLIGFFVNSLVLRGDLSGDPRFEELVGRSRRLALAAYSHQDLPFERLVEELRPERRLAHNPLFQVMFALQNTPLRTLELPGLVLAPVELDFPATRFDLEIFFTEVAGDLAIQLTCSADLFETVSALRLLDHLQALLAAAIAEPSRRLSELPLLSAAERQQALVEWNDTAAEIPREDLAALFAEQARQRPDRVAVSSEEGELTYGELARRAGRLARRLAAAGVGPEVRVAVLARRSPALVAGLLGILAAGGAYVPLDPSYPVERLAFMLADSGARVLVGEGEHLAELATAVLGALNDLDERERKAAQGRGDQPPPPREPSAWLDLRALTGAEAVPEAVAAAGPARGLWSAGRELAERLAYVMYTSGSTGRPKGVGITHRGIVRLVRRGGFAELGEGEVFLQLAPISFDASTLELWAPLLNGGRVALFPPRRPSLEEVGEAVARWGVSSLWLTAGLFHQMVEHDVAALAPLRQLLAGGDVLSPAHVRRALAALPGLRLVNGYGPTEATTFTCCQPHTAAAEVGASVALGRPIGNTRVYVLGPRREPVPAGAWGELWVGGEGLARGYLGRPELTAESFAPDPFASGERGDRGNGGGELSGERLYRTGDVGRFLPDGRIEFRGRRDGQVKVRGFRVELGEVESALGRHPRVRAAAAGLPPRQAGEPLLVAYVVPRPPANAPVPAPGPLAPGQGHEHLLRWRELYDELYVQGAPAGGGDAGFNVAGWNSSYTGAPIPAEEMREWLDGIEGRLLRLPHRRVLEVGCGTGLVLFRLAPRAERYRGTDFSAVALAQVREELGRRGLERRVELVEAPADDWTGVDAGELDLVVLSSVVQYCPGVDYLVAVLTRAVEAVAPGGAVFVGDLRSLPLLEAFHASVEIHRAAPGLPVSELAARVRRQAAEEEELVIDPRLFFALARQLPAITRVEVQLERGRHANELTRFRYDVVLHVGAPPREAAAAALGEAPALGAAAGSREAAEAGEAPPVLGWEEDGLSLEELERRLPEAGALAVRGIPNARLAAEAVALELLAGGARDVEDVETVGELRAEIARRLAARAAHPSSRPVDPEELWALADRLGYQAELTWSAAGGVDGRFDACFRRPAAAGAGAAAAGGGSSAAGDGAGTAGWSPAAAGGWPDAAAGHGGPGGEEAAPWSAWANDPLAAGEERRLVSELRRWLEAELPDYMMPSAFVVLDALPLTANGKVDRTALPAPESLGQPAAAWVAPATPLERLLAAVAAEVLGLERVGRRDNFFDLGGHSLLATQLVSRLRQEHGLPVTLQMIFDAADLGTLAERIAQREAESAAAARQVLTAPPPAERIPRRPAHLDRVPASFAQERLWFLDRLAPGNATYTIPLALAISGRLEPAALEAAMREVVRRHEALRTTFGELDGEAVQVIAPPPRRWFLRRIDLTALPAGARSAEARRLGQQEAERPFQLASGPLLRAVLVGAGAGRHALLLSMHHIVSDGWSMGVLVREIAALYGAAVASRPSPLPALPIQYADFAVWQRSWLAGEVLARQVAYWRQRLAGAPAALDLPLDRPRPPHHSDRGAHLVSVFASDLMRQLRRLARRHEASLYMVLLAGFQALLGRLAGQRDLCVGSPIANRHLAEVEPLIGFFVNTLVMRGDLAGNPPFSELLARTRRSALGAYAHQDLPFERLVSELGPERQLAVTPLFQVMCALQNAPVGRVELPGLSLEPIEIAATAAQFDLELHAWEQADDDSLRVVVAYHLALFDAATVRRLAGHLETLLRAAAADPERGCEDLPLLAAAQRHQLLAEWNDTVAGRPSPGLRLHDLFAAQAARTPDATALLWHGGGWSYRHLRRRALRLARRLRELGVGPDVPVGICLRRSPEMVAAVLGVLAAGGAFLPLDPAYPRQRLAAMMERTRARVLLTEEDLLSGLPPASALAAAGVTVMLAAAGDAPAAMPEAWQLEGRAAQEAAGPAADPGGPPAEEPEVRCDHLAYIIFTSGSTGTPKAIAMPHRAIVNLCLWQLGQSALPAGAKTLQFASLSFDVSYQELFSAWAAAGTVVLIPEAVRLDPAALLETLVREQVERLFLPFVALQQLAESAVERQRFPPALREVVTAGEQLHAAAPIAELFTGLPAARLWNQYGPSECHVTTAFSLSGAAPDWPALPPIGRPVANARVHLLDPAFLPVPPGVPAELYIGGPGLARGYIGSPELTAERFVPDPMGGRGRRLYRTGDLARYRPDGDLDFLGRNDQQVKIRGFRVEPGEIEAALATHPGVREAAVVARGCGDDGEGRDGGPGDGPLRLVAYVVPREGAAPAAAELRGWLRETFPEHLVPAAIQLLASLPLTVGGKVDRRALPAPRPEAGAAARGSVPPRTPLEETLAAMWRELLGIARVGVRDSFFDLGGHSLLAVRLMARIRRHCGRDLPLASLFAGPTIDRLAALIEQPEGAPGRRAIVVELAPGAASLPPLFLVHPVGGGVLCYAALARGLVRQRPGLPLYGLQSPDWDGQEPATLEAMAERYAAALRGIQPRGPYRLGGWSTGGVIAFELARQLEQAGEEIELLALIDAYAPGHPRAVGGDELDETAARALFARDLAGLMGRELPAEAGGLARLDAGTPFAAAFAQAQAAGLLPAELDLAATRQLYASFRANLRRLQRYAAAPYPGRVTVFRATIPPPLTPPPPAPGAGDGEPGSAGAAALGWEALAAAVEVEPIAGDHYDVVKPPAVEELAKRLSARLGASRSVTSLTSSCRRGAR